MFSTRYRQEVRYLRYTATQLGRVIERQGIKKSVIAREIGKSGTFLSLVIRGERTIGQEDAERIATFFRLPLDVLFKESAS